MAFKTTLLPEQKVVDPAAVITEDGKALTVTDVIFDTDELHVPNVATTVNDPVDVATYVDAVAPDIAVPFLYHWLPLDADDVNVTLLP